MNRSVSAMLLARSAAMSTSRQMSNAPSSASIDRIAGVPQRLRAMPSAGR